MYVRRFCGPKRKHCVIFNTLIILSSISNSLPKFYKHKEKNHEEPFFNYRSPGGGKRGDPALCQPSCVSKRQRQWAFVMISKWGQGGHMATGQPQPGSASGHMMGRNGTVAVRKHFLKGIAASFLNGIPELGYIHKITGPQFILSLLSWASNVFPPPFHPRESQNTWNLKTWWGLLTEIRSLLWNKRAQAYPWCSTGR